MTLKAVALVALCAQLALAAPDHNLDLLVASSVRCSAQRM
jgi:hypothetical protein